MTRKPGALARHHNNQQRPLVALSQPPTTAQQRDDHDESTTHQVNSRQWIARAMGGLDKRPKTCQMAIGKSF
jgi:hypothetical protein